MKTNFRFGEMLNRLNKCGLNQDFCFVRIFKKQLWCSQIFFIGNNPGAG
jgi:hypothetical protein